MTIGFLAIILLSIIDYIGYNNWGFRYVNQFFNSYRIFIIIIQVFICVTLFYFFSNTAVLIFLWLWWTGLADFLYYLIDEIRGGNEQFFKWGSNVTMNWLYFTPYGLYKKIILKSDITKKEFLIQLIIGILIILILNINERIY